MGKLKTPDWILQGKSKPEKKKAGKTYKIRRCPKCRDDKVNVVLTGEENKPVREWECRKCSWKGTDIDEQELSEEEFLKYIEYKGED